MAFVQCKKCKKTLCTCSKSNKCDCGYSCVEVQTLWLNSYGVKTTTTVQSKPEDQIETTAKKTDFGNWYRDQMENPRKV